MTSSGQEYELLICILTIANKFHMNCLTMHINDEEFECNRLKKETDVPIIICLSNYWLKTNFQIKLIKGNGILQQPVNV